ncbi:MAG: nitrate reductase [Desulfovibrio sp.]|nr:nitrate reductase [Desulfovibrio sp.]
MTTLFYLLGYLAVVGFIVLAVLRLRAYRKASPLHVRWELYPVPHEGPKANYGGSFMEDKEWWNKPRHISHWGDIKAILTEVLFLHATFEHNLKLWFRTYPFHFGMYMLMGGTIIVFLSVILQFLGVDPQGGFMTFVGNVISAVVLVGSFGIVGGGIGLILRRRADEGLKRYTTLEHYVNLGSFVLFGLLALCAWAFNPSYFDLSCAFIANLLTFNFEPLPSCFFTLNLLVGFLVLILIPVTNMTHLILKYYMYHDIRWGDEPTNYSEANKQAIGKMLKFKTTWSADHIAGPNGAKTWVDVATTNPAAPKE